MCFLVGFSPVGGKKIMCATDNNNKYDKTGSGGRCYYHRGRRQLLHTPPWLFRCLTHLLTHQSFLFCVLVAWNLFALKKKVHFLQ